MMKVNLKNIPWRQICKGLSWLLATLAGSALFTSCYHSIL